MYVRMYVLCIAYLRTYMYVCMYVRDKVDSHVARCIYNISRKSRRKESIRRPNCRYNDTDRSVDELIILQVMHSVDNITKYALS